MGGLESIGNCEPVAAVNQSPESCRIGELEHALRKCIDYLAVLPKVPTTYHLTQYCRDVLERATSPIILEGAKYAPSGLMIAKVTLMGRIATVRTAVCDPLDLQTRQGIAGQLAAGVSIGLTSQA